MATSLDVGLLGPLQVVRDGETVRIAAPKQRALLALLALEVGQTVSTDELADSLWRGEPPDSAATALQVYVSQLRKLVGRDAIGTRRPGYALDLGRDAVDVGRFERLVTDGRALLAAGDADGAVGMLGEAIELWRGQALAEFVYEDWAAAPARRLEELRLVALEDRLDAKLQTGRGGDLTGELEQLVAQHPLRERLRGQLMLALYRGGRQADALTAYQDARRALVDELGIDPSPALVEFERRILVQDPSLLAAGSSAPVEVSRADRVPAVRLSKNPAAIVVCSACDSPVPAEAKFCPECGAAVASRDHETGREQRKLVTVLFCDIVGSTALGERLDAEVVRVVMSRFFASVSAVISRHGGSVEKFIGDAVVAMFGIPTIHEDDALRAVRAAEDIRTAVGVLAAEMASRWDVQIETRIGINTGEVVTAAAGGALATGDAVNVAARLEQMAAAGETLIGDATWQLVRDAVVADPNPKRKLKGKELPVGSHRLVQVIPGGEGHRRRTDVTFVGRDRELTLLLDSYERWVAERACGLVTLLGTAGVGKSRLVGEVLADIGDEPRTIRGRCLPYGTGITYWPLAEAVRQLGGLDEEQTHDEVRRVLAECVEGADNVDLIVAGLLALLGVAGANAGAGDVRWAVARLFEHVARSRPLILVIDDLQWAESALLDLVDGMLDSVHGAPVLVLCIARPELLDARPDWGGGKLNATTVLLEPLGPADTSELVGRLLGGRQAPTQLIDRLTSLGGGNPLFAEELLAYLQETGHVVIDQERVEVPSDLRDVALPPTLRAIISARVDQLPAEERAVMERGSVEGEVFHAGVVAALNGGSEKLPELQRLVRSQLLKPERGELPGQQAFRFRHLLIRDAVYEGIPKAQRADWHARFAEWLEAAVGQRVSEYEEILAYHYLASWRYSNELGTDDAALRERAVELLWRAADRAICRNDLSGGAELRTQLLDLLPAHTEDRVVALADRAVLQAHVEWSSSVALESLTLADAEIGSSRASAIYVQAATAIVGGRTGVAKIASIDDLAEIAEEASAAGWERVAAMAWWSVAWSSAMSGMQMKPDAVQRCRRHSQRGGVGWLEQQADFIEGILCSSGSMPISEAIARCEELYPTTSTRQLTRVLRSVHLGWLKAMAGEFEAAGRIFDEGEACSANVETLESWPLYQWGIALTYVGRYDEAIPRFERAQANWQSHGGRELESGDHALTAYVLVHTGRCDESAAFVSRAENGLRPHDPWSRGLLGTTRAYICLARGAYDDACSEAEKGCEWLEPTDHADALGLALIDLATIFKASGRRSDAHNAASRAVRILAARGAVAMVERAQTILDDVTPAVV